MSSEIRLCVQWCSDRASRAPGGHGSSSGNSWPLIQRTGTSKSPVCCVLPQVHREACCLKVVERGRVFVPASQGAGPVGMPSSGLSHMKTVLELELFSQKCGRLGPWPRGAKCLLSHALGSGFELKHHKKKRGGGRWHLEGLQTSVPPATCVTLSPGCFLWEQGPGCL